MHIAAAIRFSALTLFSAGNEGAGSLYAPRHPKALLGENDKSGRFSLLLLELLTLLLRFMALHIRDYFLRLRQVSYGSHISRMNAKNEAEKAAAHAKVV